MVIIMKRKKWFKGSNKNFSFLLFPKLGGGGTGGQEAIQNDFFIVQTPTTPYCFETLSPKLLWG